MDKIGTIEFPTASARALWVCEILGQMSDGMWENTAPHDHWKFWHRLEPKVGCCKVTMYHGWWVPHRQKVAYNIAGLYPIVGDRMRANAQMGRALASLGVEAPTCEQLEAGEYLDELGNLEGYKRYIDAGMNIADSYRYPKVAAVPYEHLVKFYETLYGLKDLKQDVAYIKRAMKTAREL